MLKQLRLYNRYIAALLLVVSSVCSLFISASASATTDYDEVYRTTSNIGLSNNGWPSAYTECAYEDYTDSWKQTLLSAPQMTTPYADSFNEALENGKMGVSKDPDDILWTSRRGFVVYWTEDASLQLDWTEAYGGHIVGASGGSSFHSVLVRNHNAQTSGSDCSPHVILGGGSLVSAPDQVGPDAAWNLFVDTNNPNYPTDPSGYEGEQVRSSDDDIDGDGLDRAQEESQFTSNFKKDTDGDGLDDYVESELYSNRAAVFCDDSSCTNHDYPNPLVQDVYVEIDWMNDGTQDYKPTSGQISTVIDTFEDQDIIAHFDTGQLGGGGQLPTLAESLLFKPTVDKIDFFDLKNGTTVTTPAIDPQFSPFRENIWHYMITGMNFTRQLDENDDPIAGTSGAAYPGNDASIISMEMLEADFPNTTERDKAVSGTILHELGHNLCLTHPGEETRLAYANQSAECVYEGIDNKSDLPPINDADAFYNLENFESVMNYRYQLADQDDMGSIDYSDGSHGTGDHNDWTAVFKGIDDFVSNVEPSESSSRRGGIELEPVE